MNDRNRLMEIVKALFYKYSKEPGRGPASAAPGPFRRISAAFALLLVILLWQSLPAIADILVRDTVTRKNRETTLTAETQGRFLNRGGELVEFFVGKVSLGRVLSGGDGIAYKHFSPGTTGLERIIVKSGQEEGTGLLLVLGRNSAIVLADIESALMEETLIRPPRPGSQKALASVNKRFPVILLQSDALGLKATRQWLREHGFEDLPVLPRRGGALFDEIAGMGIRIRAVVGSKAVVGSARRHKAQLFTFEEVEKARQVKEWDEISRSLGTTR